MKIAVNKAEKKKEKRDKYREKWPEKRMADLRVRKMKGRTPGKECHHWSYNEEHWKDIIELTPEDHRTIHKYIKYSIPYKMYVSKEDFLLYTKEMHIKYIDSILKTINETRQQK